jgi:hypothetical protein
MVLLEAAAVKKGNFSEKVSAFVKIIKIKAK